MSGSYTFAVTHLVTSPPGLPPEVTAWLHVTEPVDNCRSLSVVTRLISFETNRTFVNYPNAYGGKIVSFVPPFPVAQFESFLDERSGLVQLYPL